jgi:hypothetical protein
MIGLQGTTDIYSYQLIQLHLILKLLNDIAHLINLVASTTNNQNTLAIQTRISLTRSIIAYLYFLSLLDEKQFKHMQPSSRFKR